MIVYLRTSLSYFRRWQEVITYYRLSEKESYLSLIYCCSHCGTNAIFSIHPRQHVFQSHSLRRRRRRLRRRAKPYRADGVLLVHLEADRVGEAPVEVHGPRRPLRSNPARVQRQAQVLHGAAARCVVLACRTHRIAHVPSSFPPPGAVAATLLHACHDQPTRNAHPPAKFIPPRLLPLARRDQFRIQSADPAPRYLPEKVESPRLRPSMVGRVRRRRYGGLEGRLPSGRERRLEVVYRASSQNVPLDLPIPRLRTGVETDDDCGRAPSFSQSRCRTHCPRGCERCDECSSAYGGGGVDEKEKRQE